MKYEYFAADGSVWTIRNVCPPIPLRCFDWEYVHDEYDGAPDAFDDRHGNVASMAEAIEAIEEHVSENWDGKCYACEFPTEPGKKFCCFACECEIRDPQ